MATKLLTLKEIAQILSIPESSLRKYRELFAQFIPGVGKGRSRRYRTEAIEIFKDIRDLREDMQMPWDAITDKLAEKYPMDALPPDADGAAPANLRTETAPQPDLFSAPPEPEVAEPRRAEPGAEPEPRPEPRRLEPHAEPQEPSRAVDRPAAVPGAAYLRKIAAISEKQMMIVNAMALELMQSVDRIRIESRQEIELMHKEMLQTLTTMQRSFGEMSRDEKKLLADVQGRLTDVRQTIGRIEKSGDRAVRLVEIEAQLKTVQRKLEQREKLIQEYKNSFEVLKRENTELRAFKNRHIDTAEERVREVKGLRKTPLLKRMFGQQNT